MEKTEYKRKYLPTKKSEEQEIVDYSESDAEESGEEDQEEDMEAAS